MNEQPNYPATTQLGQRTERIILSEIEAKRAYERCAEWRNLIGARESLQNCMRHARAARALAYASSSRAEENLFALVQEVISAPSRENDVVDEQQLIEDIEEAQEFADGAADEARLDNEWATKAEGWVLKAAEHVRSLCVPPPLPKTKKE